jgi:hypothetical protein
METSITAQHARLVGFRAPTRAGRKVPQSGARMRAAAGGNPVAALPRLGSHCAPSGRHTMVRRAARDACISAAVPAGDS